MLDILFRITISYDVKKTFNMLLILLDKLYRRCIGQVVQLNNGLLRWLY